MKFWLTPSGGYYANDQLNPEDIEVPERPSMYHSFVDGSWVLTTSGQIAKLKAESLQDEIDNPITERGLAEILITLVTSPAVLTAPQILSLPAKHGLRRLYERELRQATRRAQISALGG